MLWDALGTIVPPTLGTPVPPTLGTLVPPTLGTPVTPCPTLGGAMGNFFAARTGPWREAVLS